MASGWKGEAKMLLLQFLFAVLEVRIILCLLIDIFGWLISILYNEIRRRQRSQEVRLAHTLIAADGFICALKI